MLKSLATAASAAAAALGIACAAHAQPPAYPNRPVTLVVPFAAGGTVNLMGRLIATRLGEVLGQPVIVDNKPGGGGSIGASFVAKAPADGYTLLLATQGQQSILPAISKKLPYDAQKDFAPIALFSTVPNVLAVSADMPVRNMDEFIQYAKANPGKLNMGSAGIGSTNHLTGELFAYRTGVRFTHVPYKGAGPAATDLLSGQIQVLFTNLPNVLAYAKAGRVKLLGIASARRSPLIPGVPTFAEAGVKGAEVDSWNAFMAPARTPPEIVKKLQEAVLSIANDKQMAALLAEQGAEPFPGTGQDLSRLSEQESRRWAEVVRHANIQLD
jgi:tripartite-type tricarboxylate transporter receptor subunit TctC